MKLIIGGAYQGKQEFAKEAFSFKDADIYTCCGETVDFSYPCVDKIEEFALAYVRAGKEPLDYFREHRSEWENAVLICEDIFCGVVPMDAELREWRQATGRLCQYLSKEAQQVSRIFCGLEQRLK